MRTHIQRLGGFTFWLGAAAVAPVILLPLVAHHSTNSQFVALLSGQSIGAFAVLLVSGGWNFAGPTWVAQTPKSERDQLYASSLSLRLGAFMVAAPLAVVACAFITEGGQWLLASSIALAVLLSGLSPSWFNIGEGRPRDLALFDALPRILTLLVSAVVIGWSGWLWAWPALLAVGTAAGAVAFALRGRSAWRSEQRSQHRRTLRQLVSPTLTTLAAGGYTAANVALVAAVAAPSEAAVFGVASKLFQANLLILTAVGQTFQSVTVEQRGGLAQVARYYVVTVATGAAAFAAFGPPLSDTLFGRDLRMDYVVSCSFGLAFLALGAATLIVKQVHLPRGKTRPALVSTLVGNAVGVPLVLWLSATSGAQGASIALAATESLALVILVIAGHRSEDRSTAPAASATDH